MDVFEAIQAIKADAGIAVLAHPGHQNTYYLIDSLVDAGLDGIELYHEMNTTKDHEIIQQLADEKKLILTGGSDFHGARSGVGSVAHPAREACKCLRDRLQQRSRDGGLSVASNQNPLIT